MLSVPVGVRKLERELAQDQAKTIQDLMKQAEPKIALIAKADEVSASARQGPRIGPRSAGAVARLAGPTLNATESDARESTSGWSAAASGLPEVDP